MKGIEMKKGIVLLAMLAVVFSCVGIAAAGELGTSVSAEYKTRSMLYGMDTLPDDDGVFTPSATIDLWGTGFSATVVGKWATEGEHVDDEELDYTLAYDFSLMKDESAQTDVTLNYTYYDFYRQDSQQRDFYETGAKFAMPNIIGNNVVPYYRLVFLEPIANGEQGDAGLDSPYDLRGFLHIIGVDYTMNLECPMSETKQPIVFGASTVFNDGWGYENVDHDWSHATFEVKAPIADVLGGTLTPSVAYQVTMEDTVNDDQDEIIFGIKYTYAF